nr:unnamed protein product [Callosobruchus analis]
MSSPQNQRKQLLLVLGAVAITAASLPKCPPNKSSKSIYIPHETNCSLFYECGSDGIPILEECSEGLDFNPVLQVCDYPDHAGCRNKTTTIPQPTSKKGTTVTEPPKTTKVTTPSKATKVPITTSAWPKTTKASVTTVPPTTKNHVVPTTGKPRPPTKISFDVSWLVSAGFRRQQRYQSPLH